MSGGKGKLEELFELPEDRLATTDAQGNRVYLYTADVRGHFHKLRGWFHLVLLVVFLALPWIPINGQPAVLLDILDRKFAIFGLTFWAHDAPMLFFVFGSVAFGIAFITAVWGRVWCGWGCPETVFTESVYRKVERMIEGAATSRRNLDQGPWNFKKIWKKSLKWFLFWLISMVITHSFIAYFVGAERLAGYIGGPISDAPTVFAFAFFITIILMIAFGWFREQFCIIACPYGRMQSFLLDENSLTVAYDEKRGEPRRAKGVSKEAQGDCVSCYRCVQVCPTGIDIRRGLQMECIACTACIDACDEVMEKVKKPKGLIRYNTLDGKKIKLARPRPIIYGTILSILLAGLTFTVYSRDNVDIKVLRAKDIPYQQVKADGKNLVINHFKLTVANNHFEPIKVQILPAAVKNEGDSSVVEVITHRREFIVRAGQKSDLQFFTRFEQNLLEEGKTLRDVQIKLIHPKETRTVRKEAKLVGPF